MPIFEIQDPNTGRTIELEGDSPPSEAELEQIFQGIQAETGAVAQPAAIESEEEPGFLEQAVGVGEAGLAVGSKLTGLAVGGIGGLAKSLTTGSEAGQQTAEQIAEAFTFEPRTEQGQAALSGFGEGLGSIIEAGEKANLPLVTPLAEIFSGKIGRDFGEFIFEKTGSPMLSALAATSPDLLLELGTLGAGKVTRARRFASQRKKEARIEGNEIKSLLENNANNTQTLNQFADGLYNELDNAGITIKAPAYRDMIGKIRKMSQEKGLIKGGKGNAATRTALNDLSLLVGKDLTTREIQSARKIITDLGKSTEPVQQLWSQRMKKIFDGFVDNMGPGAFNNPRGSNINIPEVWKTANGVWRRFRKSEVLDETGTSAGFVKSGETIESIRGKLSTRLQNEAKRGQFTKLEQSALSKVIDPGQVFRLLEGMEKAIPGGSFTAIAGAGGLSFFFGGGLPALLAAGATGGVIVGAKRLRDGLVRSNFEFAKALVKAGPDARNIARAYNKSFKAGRKPEDLSLLLLDRRIPLPDDVSDPFLKEAIRLAKDQRRLLAVAGTEAAISGQVQEQP